MNTTLCSLFFLLFSLTLGYNAEASNHDDHAHSHHGDHGSHGDKEDAFTRMYELLQPNDTLGNDSHLETASVHKLLREVFHRFSCHQKSSINCSECFQASTVFSVVGANVSHGLEEEQYNQASVMILYFLHGLESDTCNLNNTLEFDFIAEEFMKVLTSGHASTHMSTGSSGHKSTEHDWEHFLEDLNKTYTPHEADHETGCVSSKVLFTETGLNVTTVASEEQSEHMAAMLVYFMVKGFAIKASCEEETPTTITVDKTLFLDSLFEVLNVTSENGTLSEEAFETLLTKLKIGAVHGNESKTAPGGHDEHAGHDHRKKRDLGSEVTHRRKRAAGDAGNATEDHEHDHEHEAVEKCFNAEDLLTVFGVDHEAGVSRQQFVELCPALIQQQLTGVCAHSEVTNTSTSGTNRKSSTAEMYGYGSLAVFIISLLAIGGVFLIPCMGHTVYQYVMETFIALAVGTMAGDALLHLIPQALGLHGHDAEAALGHDHSDINNIVIDNYVWYTGTVLLAIYGFFILETIMGMIGGGHNHSHMGPDKKPEIVHKEPVEADFAHSDEVIRRSFRRKKNQSASMVDFADKEIPSINVVDEDGMSDNHIKQNGKGENGNAHSLSDVKVTESEPDTLKLPTNSLYKAEEMKQDDDKNNLPFYKRLKPVAYMTLIGDTIHNIVDGIAIGAAFTSGLFNGLATSIAVFCHELPHEFGDFAILLTGGFSFKQAVVCNFLSALASFIGLFIGIAIAIDDSTRSWIFAITAGMFLYISLVDMLPELINMKAPGNRCISFLLQNFGILFGFGTMLCLSVFEDYIKI